MSAAPNSGLNPQVVHLSGKDHAGYYPDATDIYLKLIFDADTGKIYGAQGIGTKGVDKRIDILATAIKGDLTILTCLNWNSPMHRLLAQPKIQ